MHYDVEIVHEQQNRRRQLSQQLAQEQLGCDKERVLLLLVSAT
jgi:hypothetical protein